MDCYFRDRSVSLLVWWSTKRYGEIDCNSTHCDGSLCIAVDTEQQEILDLILRSLGEAELYYLRALLMVSTHQSLVLVINLLSNIAPSPCRVVNSLKQQKAYFGV